ncbi:MAG TPA: metalloregulator ArsR/SmtB family transcription factor [Anaerolineales bacterium]|nr:metalloregulator ArsR/SmtB family transcription factor [Anaerolineales bacterium]
MNEQVFDALGHPTRREILALLRGAPLPVGVIADHFPISRPAISKHLRILQEAGLVGMDEQGTKNIFSLRLSGFQDAKAYLDSFWDQALLNFKNFAEKTPET